MNGCFGRFGLALAFVEQTHFSLKTVLLFPNLIPTIPPEFWSISILERDERPPSLFPSSSYHSFVFFSLLGDQLTTLEDCSNRSQPLIDGAKQ